MENKNILNDLEITLGKEYKEARLIKKATYEELQDLDSSHTNTYEEVKNVIDEHEMYEYIINTSDNKDFVKIATNKRNEFNFKSKINDIVNKIDYKFLDDCFIKITEDNKKKLEDKEYDTYVIPF